MLIGTEMHKYLTTMEYKYARVPLFAQELQNQAPKTFYPSQQGGWETQIPPNHQLSTKEMIQTPIASLCHCKTTILTIATDLNI